VDRHERFGVAHDRETVQIIQRHRLGLARWGDCLAQFTATDSGGPAGQGRPRRLLDVHLHQLASHTAVRSRVAARYREQGLVVIGVHTPEFTFEEDIDNVRKAAGERGVTYPIAIDNNRAIWSGFGNHYWPALYFIDASGRVRDHHFGEGSYEASELRIRQLLAAAGSGGETNREPVSIEARGPEVGADWGSLKSPETYIGHQKAENFVSPGGAAVNMRRAYAVPPRLRLNQWALSGDWTLKTEAAVLNAAGGRIAYRFHARDLHLIMGPSERRGAVRFRVFIDGQPPGADHGSDVDDQGQGTVTDQRLYQLVRQSGPIADRQFEIEFLDSSVRVHVRLTNMMPVREPYLAWVGLLPTRPERPIPRRHLEGSKVRDLCGPVHGRTVRVTGGRTNGQADVGGAHARLDPQSHVDAQRGCRTESARVALATGPRLVDTRRDTESRIRSRQVVRPC
jgi:Thioredoxin like C-terminal domain